MRAIDVIFTRSNKDIDRLKRMCEEVVAFSPIRGGRRKARPRTVKIVQRGAIIGGAVETMANRQWTRRKRHDVNRR